MVKFRFPKYWKKGEKPWIIAAPMNGGINNPIFSAAVMNSGGIGSFGFTYHTPEAIIKEIKETRALGKGPINANFFIFDKHVPTISKEYLQNSINDLKNTMNLTDLEINIPKPPYSPCLDDQIEAIWKIKPEILTFHYGIPDAYIIKQAQKYNISIGITATNLHEALAIQDSGADFIIAQGREAGGHRGTFHEKWDNIDSLHRDVIKPNSDWDSDLTTQQLLHTLTTSTSTSRIVLPIVVAGGIMHGKDAYNMLQQGASAIQCGTIFLPCLESTATTEHKSYILSSIQRDSIITKTFSGRAARGIRNEYIDQMEGKCILPFPLQNTLTSVLRKHAVSRGDGERQSLWAGEGFYRARERVVCSSGSGNSSGSTNGSGDGSSNSNNNSETTASTTTTTSTTTTILEYPSVSQLMTALYAEIRECST